MKCFRNLGNYLFALACLLGAPTPPPPVDHDPNRKPDDLPPGTAVASPYDLELTDDQKTRALAESDANAGTLGANSPKCFYSYCVAIGRDWCKVTDEEKTVLVTWGYRRYLRIFSERYADNVRIKPNFS